MATAPPSVSAIFRGESVGCILRGLVFHEGIEASDGDQCPPTNLYGAQIAGLDEFISFRAAEPKSCRSVGN